VVVKANALNPKQLMKTLTLSLLASTLLAPQAIAGGDLVAIRVGRAETVSQGTIEHAVILLEDGKIVTIGQDLPIARGIPTLDRPNWTVMPGLINAYSRIGLQGSGSTGSDAHLMASAELYPRDAVYADLVDFGFTTFGLYPAGSGIPGQAVAIRPIGDTAKSLIIRNKVYLKIRLASNAGSKKMLRDGFGLVDKFDEKEAKRLEKWEKDQEKAKKKKKKSKKDDDKDDDKEDEKEEKPKDAASDEFVSNQPDEKAQPFAQLRAGELSALFSIRRASDFIHLIDALDEEEITWNLRVPLRDDIDLYEVIDQIGELEKCVIVEPRLTQHPSTRRLRNLPLELSEAGASLAFIPLRDSFGGHEDWRMNVAALIRDGMDRDIALRAMTLGPAELLGLGDRVGSLEAGKDANLVFLTGDPFEASSKVEAVMLEGKVVFGELN
jgi:hypothetical protein